MKQLLENWRQYLKEGINIELGNEKEFDDRLSNENESYSLVGNCKDFDEDGDCTIDSLPYTDATEFAQAEEKAFEISAEDFQAAVGDIEEVDEPFYLYDEANDVYMIYDAAEDIHYFYVRDGR